MIRFLFISTLTLVGHFAEALSPKNTDTLPNVIIISAFDASSTSMRKNKRELFRELTDSLRVYLAENIKTQFGLPSAIVPGMKQTSDSSVLYLMRLSQARMAIVIQALDVYFDEGSEKHVEEYGSTPKLETNYNLCSKVDYTFYTIDSASQKKQVNLCDYFTTRSVNDKGFVIKFGPDIVGKKRHTFGAVERNAANYIQSLTSYFERLTNQ